MDLAEFLLARIAEDEAVARAATGEQWRPGAFVQDGRRLWSVSADPRPLVARIELEPDTVHIARHDPARVLAECDAKRRIVEYLDDYGRGVTDGAANHLMGDLALPYVDHPDYNPEWRL